MSFISRRAVLGGAAITVAAGGAIGLRQLLQPGPSPKAPRPNIIVILTDDQGYNDIGCYYQTGPDHDLPPIPTPRLDAMATQGLRLTDFSAAAAVCTPSRAALLTGCYPPRVGFGVKRKGVGVLTPKSTVGLNPDETTLAELLRDQGYATACIGKWHLGHLDEFLPMRHGFTDFYGIPYSNNQRPLPLMRNNAIIRTLPDEPVLVAAFTQAAQTFIQQNTAGPFFLYLAHSAPHYPWNVRKEHRTNGPRGLYGDVIQRIDWSVGELLDQLDSLGIADNTLVLFASDNGPWLDPTVQAGDAFPFRGGKGESWEGGFRSPCILRWPAVLPAGTVSDAQVSTLDVLPTLASLAGAKLPTLPIDGNNVWASLTEGVPSPSRVFFYFARGRLEAVRSGNFKLVFANLLRDQLEALFDLAADPSESTDVHGQHPAIVADLHAHATHMRGELGDTLTEVEGRANRPIGQ